ncbi:hypothetical protein Y1Q_0003281 [Alligator mississippiensis]|uniref:Uncharacterized protein n=1 Tax=Alligator mississippiensis TaxID=8496 RepID=A0A151ME75_ALLMI|nr:hypothetical protein Y1Q_0003281 [Alligator mississippiensis]
MAHHCFTPRQLCGIHGPVPDEMENAPCADLIVCAPSSSSLKAYRIPQRETAVLLLLNSLEQLSHQLFSCWMSSSTSWENGGVDDCGAEHTTPHRIIECTPSHGYRA